MPPLAAAPARSSTQFLRTGTEAGGVAIEAQGARAYVADTKEGFVFVFDLASGNPTSYIPVGYQPYQVAIVGARGFVANFADHSITVFDVGTNLPVATIMAGGLGLAVNAQTRRLYAAEGTRVLILDATTCRLVGTLAVPSGANVWGLAVDAANDRVYATDIAAPRVLVFNATTGALLGTVAIAAVSRFGIAVGAPGQVLVADYTDQSPQLEVIDTATLKVVARRPIAPWTMSVAYQARTHLAITASPSDWSVTMVDPTGVVPTTRTGYATPVGAVAIDPITGDAVASAAGGPHAPQIPLPPVLPIIRP